MLLPELVQDAVVTIIAVACAVFIAWRLFAVVRPKRTGGCSNCAASKAPCVPQGENTATVAPRPLTFVSSNRRT
jgi:hypothetical protein